MPGVWPIIQSVLQIIKIKPRNGFEKLMLYNSYVLYISEIKTFHYFTEKFDTPNFIRQSILTCIGLYIKSLDW